MKVLPGKNRRVFSHRLQPEDVGALVLAALMLFWLFLFPHGLADNGDFYRSIHNFGLSHQTGAEQDDLFRYFNNRFRLSADYIDNSVSYFSSQGLLIWLSVRLNCLFLHDGTYDIRFLAGLYAAVYLAVSWCALRMLRKLCGRVFGGHLEGKGLKAAVWLMTAFFLFVFGDFGYLLYFNSFFGEPMFYVFFLLYATATAAILTGTGPPKAMLALYTGSALLFIGAKQQGAPLGIVVVLFTLRLMTLDHTRRWKAACASLAGGMALFSVLCYTGISDEIQYINKYHAMTLGVMQYETDAQQLKDLDVPPQLLLLKGTTVYDEYPAALPDSPLLYRQLYDRAGTGKIVAYYLKHPNQLTQVADDAARASYTIKPAMLGNFLKSSGKAPYAQSGFFSGWSALKQIIFPKTFGFILIFFFIIAGGLAARHFRYRREGSAPGCLAAEFLWGVELMALIQFAVAFIGAGEADIAKHLFYFSVMFDLLFAFSVFEVVRWLVQNRIGKRKLSEGERS